ncbi:hypothetical protein [Niabella aurantiaca]|uniref:hypothetical protein n=1 Tax=Niabella aurantiaca TaxID=379900 RepID=UPI00036DEDFA|nr:hypothetical protein [Niabella aurantiaca]
MFPQDQIEELKRIAPNLCFAEEGGYPYILIEQLQLPDGCQPAMVDVLLCPKPRDGYKSRLFFPQVITGIPARNWNGNIRVLERNWCAMSWQVPEGLRLAEVLLIHLKALKL